VTSCLLDCARFAEAASVLLDHTHFFPSGTWVDLDARKRPKFISTAGWRVFGPVAQMSKNRRSEQVAETAAMAGKIATVTPLPEMSFGRSSGWRKLLANACIAGY
jgi:hypothetical protein